MHVQTFNFLGIMLNETLSWKSHIDMVSNKISKVIGILYRLFEKMIYINM